jgi:hypothetical protein
MTARLFSLAMTEDGSLVLCDNCHWWDNSHKHRDAQPGNTGRCEILPPVAGKRTGSAVEDTD